MARTEKEKKSSGVLQKTKNQKETRAWKNKWPAQKKLSQPDSIMFGPVGQSGWAKIGSVLSGQQK